MVAKKGARFQRRYLHSGPIRGGITQLPGESTVVISCWTWVKRAFILPILHVDLAQLGNDSLGGKTLSWHVSLLSVKVDILPHILD